METIKILWTGGWDSTYRVLQLSRKKVIIQAYYLKDNRDSEKQELEAIQTIMDILKETPETNCTFHELITLKVSDIEEDESITEAYTNILMNDFYGSQYEWLARFSKNIKELELTIHQDDKAFTIIKKYGDIKKQHWEPKGEYYILDHTVSTADLIEVFGNYHFPLLYCSKLEMKKKAEEEGSIDILNKTWFCHHPIDNKACGVCNPCQYTIEEGLEYRFSNAALRRYRMNKLLKPVKQSYIYRGIRKISRMLNPKK